RVGEAEQLRLYFAAVGEELDIVHQQHAGFGVAAAVGVSLSCGDGRMERFDEVVEGEILNRHLGIDFLCGVPDRHQQVGLAQPGPGVDKERVVDRARGLGHGARSGRGKLVRRTPNVVVEAVPRVERSTHVTELPAARRLSTSSEIPFRVSNTPVPRTASAGKLFNPKKLSDSSISLEVRTRSCGRSCLLYWSTMGNWRTSTPCASRVACKVRRLSRWSSNRGAWLSATKTTPSVPWSTSFRVAL